MRQIHEMGYLALYEISTGNLVTSSFTTIEQELRQNQGGQKIVCDVR